MLDSYQESLHDARSTKRYKLKVKCVVLLFLLCCNTLERRFYINTDSVYIIFFSDLISYFLFLS